jgi:hypothetical protein
MKAIVQDKYGSPDVLQLENISKPVVLFNLTLRITDRLNGLSLAESGTASDTPSTIPTTTSGTPSLMAGGRPPDPRVDVRPSRCPLPVER